MEVETIPQGKEHNANVGLISSRNLKSSIEVNPYSSQPCAYFILATASPCQGHLSRKFHPKM